jgi:hypothetical protein
MDAFAPIRRKGLKAAAASNSSTTDTEQAGESGFSLCVGQQWPRLSLAAADVVCTCGVPRNAVAVAAQKVLFLRGQSIASERKV